jgi:hypothetical protein
MYLEGVIVCVNYSDFLNHTLPENKAHFDNLVVVTDLKDLATVRVCEKYNVKCVQTNVFYENDAVFNKGAGINAGLAELTKQGWVIHMDADIYLPPLTRYVLEKRDLDQNKIYGVDRLMCPNYESWVAYREGYDTVHEHWTFVHLNSFPVGTRLVHYNDSDGWIPIGFFQMWHPAESGVHHYPDKHGAADRTDTLHGKKFDRNQRELLPELVVIHLESENCLMGANWNGRKTRKFGPRPRRKFPLDFLLEKFEKVSRFLTKLIRCLFRRRCGYAKLMKKAR